MIKNAILILFLISLISCSHLQESVKFARKPRNDNTKIISELEVKKDYAELAKIYEDLYNKDPSNILSLYKAAENYRLSKNLKAAINAYEKFIATDSDNKADAYEGLILCYIEEANFDEVTKLLNEIIAIDATRWRPINASAVMFALNNRYNEAISYYDLALNIEKHYSILNNKALTMAFNGNVKDAIKVIEEAARIIPDANLNKSKIAMNLAMIYGINGEMEKAQTTLEPYLSEAQIYNNLAMYAILAKDEEKSKEYLVKALDSNNHYQKAEKNLKIIEQ